MKQTPFKIITKSALVIFATLSAATIAFLFSRGGILRSEFTHGQASGAEAAGHPEDGAPCDAAVVAGDVYQGRRLDINVPDLGINQTAKIDVAKEYNQKCMNGAFPANDLHGGFSTATVEYDVNNLLNSWATMDRALALGAPEGVEGMKEGFELMEVAVWDGDLETNPHAADDFPFSCNSIYSRRREGRRNDGQPRIQDRASLGSYCCANGWGMEEYMYNPPESYIGEGTDPVDNGFKNWFENSPEPDADGDPRNGYSGTMTGHYTMRWELTNQEVDITFEKIPATHLTKNFTFFIPWPGLLYKHLTPAGGGDLGYYKSQTKGVMTDTQKGNGTWDGADAPAGNCSAAGAVAMPWDKPNDGKPWVAPTAYPCPPGTPQYDAAGNFAWYHDEPFVDDNGNGKWDEGEDFKDIGNGYGPSDESDGSDTWTYDAGTGSIDTTVAPELTFNRQIIEIADTPSPKSNGLPYAPITKFYPLTGIHIRGLFEPYTKTQCNCRPSDRQDEGVSPTGQPYFGCQATFGDFFDATQCGFCGSNQPILNGGSSDGSLNARGYQRVYCEDSIARNTNVYWPPFNFNTFSFRWEIASASVTNIFDSVFKDTGDLPSVDIVVSPVSPQKGDSVTVQAMPLAFFQDTQDMYFAWTINGLTQQGLVAGASERVPNHLAPPDFVETAPNGSVYRHKESRSFFFAPERPPKTDSNNDGMDDSWEMRYFGTLAVDPVADPDKDGYVAKDFASTRPSIFTNGAPQSTATYEDQGRFIYITPGVWWDKGNQKEFIPPDNFNPEWFPGPDKAPGLSNIEEYVWGTNPTDPDTDDDGYPDGADLVGVGQMSWSYTNEAGPLDSNRDKIGTIVMGKGNVISQSDQNPLTQITCIDKTVYPAGNTNLKLSVNFDPAVPVPGQELHIQAVTGNSDVKEGFLTYDWKVNGKDTLLAGQGKNEITLSASDTKDFVSGEMLQVDVTAYNNNPNQGSYGAVGTATGSAPIGVAYDSLEVRQNDTVIFPFPSDALNNQNRLSVLSAQLKQGIHINRTDDVNISLLNIWSNEVANNLYFEWKVDDLTQNGKAAGKGSGRGTGYTNFTFNPQSFLPNNLGDTDTVPKNVHVIGRAVDVNTQKEVFNIDLTFIYSQPGISLSESGEGGGAQVALSADLPEVANADNLLYTWKLNGNTVAEGKGQSKIQLSYLQASAAPIVELTVSNIGGVVTKKLTATTHLNLSRLSLTWKQRVAYSVYGFFFKIPQTTKKIFYGFLVANAVFFVLFGLYTMNQGKAQHARE